MLFPVGWARGLKAAGAAVGPSSAGSGAESAWLRKTITNPTPVGLMLFRVRLWKPRGQARQDPALEGQTELPGDQAGTSSQRAGRPFHRPAVEEGAAGMSDLYPLRTALAASL